MRSHGSGLKARWVIIAIIVPGILAACGFLGREMRRRRDKYRERAAYHERMEQAFLEAEQRYRLLEGMRRSIEERSGNVSRKTNNARTSEIAIAYAPDTTTMDNLRELAEWTGDAPLGELASTYSRKAQEAATQAGWAAEQARSHGQMKQRYRHAATRPWESVPAETAVRR